MCGFTGFLDLTTSLGTDDLRQQVTVMSDTIAHRGPDGSGVWVDAEAGIALGHRRLAIIDLSEAGHQPMVSSCARFIIAYNGEVYNAAELRTELEAVGRSFRGHSDTEVIVEGCAVWGVQATVERLIGMFAMAVWDRQERTLSLVRDRVGIKPLYWMRQGNRFAFGSELKTLVAMPGWTPELSREGVASFMRFTWIPAPRTVYQDVYKLEPGTILTFKDAEVSQSRYWSVDDVARAAQSAKGQMSDAEAEEALHDLLMDAVERRMVSDVPLGAFLSGGIDSSTVTALMQACSERPVRTFSIGFHEEGYNEAEHAKAVAQHLGTDHTELYVDPTQAMDVIPRLPDMYDEPFADSSQIPTFLVSQMTRDHVTVALSGDGGDELFGGYNRYLWADRFYRMTRTVPRPLRSLSASMASAVPESLIAAGMKVTGQKRSPALMKDRLLKIARILPANGADDVYARLLTVWGDVVNGVGVSDEAFLDASMQDWLPDFQARMQLFDMNGYLPDDILTKVDRASMATSLEARVPILDHRVVELAWTLRPDQKIRDGVGKHVLRQVLYRHVPRTLIERPKVGFAMPVAEWLRGPLRDWAEDLLQPSCLQADGVFDVAQVRTIWEEHQSGRRNWLSHVWAVLMFQAWKARWLP